MGNNESRMYWSYSSVRRSTGFFNTKFSAFNHKFSYGKYPPPAFTAAQKSFGHKLRLALAKLVWCYCKFKTVIFTYCHHNTWRHQENPGRMVKLKQK